MAGNQGKHLIKLNKSRRGKSLSKEHKEKIRKGHLGKGWTKAQKQAREGLFVGENNPNYGNGAKIKGNKNPNWKGGITDMNTEIRLSKQYKNWVLKVYKRDSFTCQYCGVTGSDIFNAHHIKEFSEIIEENNINSFDEALVCPALWNIDNGLTLRKSCHRKEHYVAN